MAKLLFAGVNDLKMPMQPYAGADERMMPELLFAGVNDLEMPMQNYAGAEYARGATSLVLLPRVL